MSQFVIILHLFRQGACARLQAVLPGEGEVERAGDVAAVRPREGGHLHQPVQVRAAVLRPEGPRRVLIRHVLLRAALR